MLDYKLMDPCKNAWRRPKATLQCGHSLPISHTCAL